MSNDAAKITLDALNGLSEEEKQLAIEALKQIAATGSSEILNDLQYADFDEIPVDIDTFMHDPKYLGQGLTDPEGRFTVFPY